MPEEALDRLLRALADATRRSLLDRLRDHPGLTQGELAAGFAQTRQALSKHLALLEAAELVVPLWRGREKHHYLNPAPLQALPSRWVTGTQREHQAAMSALNQALQAAAPPPAEDALAARLLAPPPPTYRLADATALVAVRTWLDDSAAVVRELAAALPPSEGYVQPSAGGFSLAEHLWHLADLEELGWTPRFERVLVQSKPRLPGVDGDKLALERRYQERPWRGAARRFIAQRRRTLRAIAQLGVDTLTRPVLFAGRASNIADLIAAMVAHDHEHRAEMAARWIARQKGIER